MPLVFRAMLSDGARPKIGPSKNALGVVAGNGEHDDLPVNELGMVAPQTGGMSVVPAWQDLPRHRIPRRFHPHCPMATGNNKLSIWQMGEGRFAESDITPLLRLVPDRPGHGTIQPSRSMLLAEFQAALGATAENWKNIEG